ncbi:MAG: DUF2298 domain-containing protein [Dehalococcoidia bacterium]
MLEIILWIVSIQILGLAGFPICYKVFFRLPDKGYIISKVLTTAILGYSVWIVTILSSWTYNQTQVLIILSAFIIFQILYLKPSFIYESLKWILSNKHIAICSELLFVSTFLICSFLVSQNPAIELTEKPMDFMILNSIMGLGNLPPDDLWLAGHSINYYYFGHFLISLIGTLLSTPSFITYNLGLVFTCATSSIILYGISYNCLHLANVKKPYILGLIPPLTTLGLGNQLGLIEFLRSINLYSQKLSQWISIDNLSYISGKSFTLFPVEPSWWWRSSRIINSFDENGSSLDYTITEFPLFSFLIGDLHAHLLSIPYLLLVFYPVLVIILFAKTKQPGKFPLLPISCVSAFLVTISTLVNPWNLPFSIIFLGVAFYYCLNQQHTFKAINIVNAKIYVIVVVGIVVCMSLPFILHYNSTNTAIALNIDFNTRWIHMLLVNGTWIFGSVAIYVICLKFIKPYLKTLTTAEYILPLSLGLSPLLLWTLLIWFVPVDDPYTIIILRKWSFVLPLCLLSSASLFVVFNAQKLLKKENIISFPLILIAIGYFILSVSELFFIVDVFNNRMNTVFKFYYQAWFFLSIGVTLFLIVLIRNSSLLRIKYRIITPVALILLVMVGPAYYPIALITSHDWINPKELTMDGISFLKQRDLAEYQTISWLSKQPAQILAESYGKDYSSHGRLSSFSAHSSVLAWPGHQIQWRNQLDMINERQMNLDQLFTTHDIALAHSLIDKYQISMIAVGPLEESIYGGNTENFFDKHFDVHYSNSNFKIYGTKYYDLVK